MNDRLGWPFPFTNALQIGALDASDRRNVSDVVVTRTVPKHMYNEYLYSSRYCFVTIVLSVLKAYNTFISVKVCIGVAEKLSELET